MADPPKIPATFHPRMFFSSRLEGHGRRLGIGYVDHGEDWCTLHLPYDPGHAGDAASGVLASGPIITLMDTATSVAAWLKRGAFLPHATLDLRVDYLRAARTGKGITGRGECYRLTRSVAFVRGMAHDGDPDDPVAHVAGTFMLLAG